jgi:hypothetical protein
MVGGTALLTIAVHVQLLHTTPSESCKGAVTLEVDAEAEIPTAHKIAAATLRIFICFSFIGKGWCNNHPWPPQRMARTGERMKTRESVKSRAVRRIKTFMQGGQDAKLYASLLLQGHEASWKVRSMKQVQSLQEVEFKVFSQWGEDGIIDWLIERTSIPHNLHTFVEFGVESYREANTRFLLENRNWRGLVMDGSEDALTALKRDPLFWQYNLKANAAFITRENINDLLLGAGFSGDIGLLSVDIDGVDYWVWEAIDVISPIICICEYNAVLGDLHAISVPYDPYFMASSSHYSGLYLGASIAALRHLADRKGYKFLGTTLAANDAFFVRQDYAHCFEGALRSHIALPSKFRCARDQHGQLSYVGGLDRLNLISHLPVVKVGTGEVVKLSDLGPVYSDEWLSQMG